MIRPTTPYAWAAVTDEDWANLGQLLAAEQVAAEASFDPRPLDERTARPSCAAALVVCGAFLVGVVWPFGSWVAAGAW